MLTAADLTVVFVYAVVLFALAQWVSREKPGHQKDARDYFLAGSSLPWWAIGASLIAANISAEQIIGMSGSGFAIGLGIASYEWMAAITLILVGKFLLPIFLKHGIYTMPQFLEQRYDHNVRMVMAFFWIGVYVFVNLTSILWLGALAMQTVAGVDLYYGMVILGVLRRAIHCTVDSKRLRSPTSCRSSCLSSEEFSSPGSCSTKYQTAVESSSDSICSWKKHRKNST
jgi:SSS family solute:Na+ symporter